MAAWGVDISNHQAGGNLAEAKAAGCSFVIAKATEGLTYTDAAFAGFAAQAAKCGLTFGAYHFARPAPGRSPAAEADRFMSVAGPCQILALDIESNTAAMTSAALAGWAIQFLRRVDSYVGPKPHLYCSRAFADWRSQPGLAEYPLWLATPGDSSPSPIPPWKSVAIVQDSWTARVSGFPSPVDHDWMLAGTVPADVPDLTATERAELFYQTEQAKAVGAAVARYEQESAVRDAANGAAVGALAAALGAGLDPDDVLARVLAAVQVAVADMSVTLHAD